jgi:hypothetical protein
MRLIGWPTNWSPDEGLLPVEIQDVDVHASVEELKQLAALFSAAAAAATGSELSDDFGDSKPNAETGIGVTVHVIDRNP